MREAGRGAGWRRAGLLLLGLALALGLAEAVVRLAWKEPAATILSADVRTLWRLPRGRTVTWNGVACAINSRGYRGPEFAVPKPGGVKRVYLCGDSSVFGDGVEFDRTFGEQLRGIVEPQLRAGGSSLEVLNGGVPGFSTVQSIVRMEEGGWAAGPDVLVIANLWSDAARTDFADSLRIERNRHAPLLRARLGLDRALNHLAVYRLGKRLLVSPRQIGRVDSEGVPLGLPHRVAPSEYRTNLEGLIAEARRRGARPVLLLLPHVTDQRTHAGARLAAMRDDLALHGWGEMEQDHRATMRAVARETGTPLVDCARCVADETEPLFLDDVHPNARGHERIARELAACLLALPGFRDDR